MDFFYDSADDLATSRCEALKDPSYVNLALSIFILLGILVSYLPQHYRIIARGTSEGISPYFILLGTTSGTCALANILVLPVSRADVACCKTVSPFECMAGLLGIAQVGIQWFCFTVILFLFLIFFPRGPALPNNSKENQYTWKTAVSVAFACLLWGLIIIFVSVGLIFARPYQLGIWANTLGITGTVLAAIQYLPQIWMTWKLGDVGSLSIPMMLIQTPGSFVWSGSLAARLGWAGWSIWGLFLVTGCLQGCLLVMGICFEVKARRAKMNSEEEVVSHVVGLELAGSNAKLKQHSNARCIVGYIQTEGDSIETDDEGNAEVENEGTERQPLIPGKSSRKSNGGKL
ncbi:Uncharacterized protein LHYA1_G006555 [Lachnellula hyalina]|uniref:PQ loop repeat protein n=1 Tax=Lachnellula hyalina TaxID=1316788 RepID=A0A8H8TWV9_9HELO|nr:Uncharacterized protein LHYA1_G006555 [Lachnellula hyalina]TVY23680.1 Uncharacterized protein LHYA1_G006555 [Lachnellula hyalina]